MDSDEVKMLANVFNQWSNDKLEIEYLNTRLKDANDTISHIQKTKDEVYGKKIEDLTAELSIANQDRDSARRKLFHCIILIDEIYEHLSSYGSINAKCGKSLMDKLLNLQKENDITVIEGGMAR